MKQGAEYWRRVQTANQKIQVNFQIMTSLKTPHDTDACATTGVHVTRTRMVWRNCAAFQNCKESDTRQQYYLFNCNFIEMTI